MFAKGISSPKPVKPSQSLATHLPQSRVQGKHQPHGQDSSNAGHQPPIPKSRVPLAVRTAQHQSWPGQSLRWEIRSSTPPPHTTSLLPFLLWESSQHPLPIPYPTTSRLPLTSPHPHLPCCSSFPTHNAAPPQNPPARHPDTQLWVPLLSPYTPLHLPHGAFIPPHRAQLKVGHTPAASLGASSLPAYLARCCSAVIYRCTPPPCCRHASCEKRKEKREKSGA